MNRRKLALPIAAVGALALLISGCSGGSGSGSEAGDPNAEFEFWSFTGIGQMDSVERYLEVLADRTVAPDDQLPDTGLDRALERAASARFVTNLVHGTRASTVLLVREDGTFEMAERSFGRLGGRKGRVAFSGAVDLPD